MILYTIVGLNSIAWKEDVLKKIALIGTLLIGLVAVISLVAAMNFGEKSSIYVSGEVKIPSSFSGKVGNIETLFVVVYDQDSPMPMPYGAMKLRLGDQVTAGQSVPFFITKERIMTMRENQPPPRRMRVKARLDRDGVAGRDQPGDLTGEVTDILLGTSGVTIEIDKLIAD